MWPWTLRSVRLGTWCWWRQEGRAAAGRRRAQGPPQEVPAASQTRGAPSNQRMVIVPPYLHRRGGELPDWWPLGEDERFGEARGPIVAKGCRCARACLHALGGGEGAVDQGLGILERDLVLGELVLVVDDNGLIAPADDIQIEVDHGHAAVLPDGRGDDVDVELGLARGGRHRRPPLVTDQLDYRPLERPQGLVSALGGPTRAGPRASARSRPRPESSYCQCFASGVPAEVHLDAVARHQRQGKRMRTRRETQRRGVPARVFQRPRSRSGREAAEAEQTSAGGADGAGSERSEL